MIPILYDSSETSFTSNGLGRLSDVISCRVTEERNGQYELEMEYPVTGIHFDEIAHSKFIYAVPSDGKNPQPFSIYFISKPISGIVSIKAEHISYRLSYIGLEPFSETTIGGALLGLTSHAVGTNPFTFWTDKTSSGTFEVEEPTSIRSVLGGQKGSILDVYGGEYEFDNLVVKLHAARGQDRGVTLRYGKNITDIRQEENISSCYTGVFPFWRGDVDGVDTVMMLTERVVYVQNQSHFPYQRVMALDLSSEYEDKPTENQLRTRAQAYITNNKLGVPKVSIDVSFVALWQTEEYKDIANLERVNLCDTVTVYFSQLGISATAKVVKTVYNVLLDRYDSIELGDTRTNLAGQIHNDISSVTEQITDQIPSKSFMQQAIDHATELITGGLGGHVVFNLNADGEPQEILIMDTDDIQTAVNVIRLNQNGIGFSNSGYSGPFVSAWTIDGQFSADFITSGSISANRISGGTFKVGGTNDGNGLLIVYNSSGQEIGRLDHTGAHLTGEIVMESNTAQVTTGTIGSFWNNPTLYWSDSVPGFYIKAVKSNGKTRGIHMWPTSSPTYYPSFQEHSFAAVNWYIRNIVLAPDYSDIESVPGGSSKANYCAIASENFSVGTHFDSVQHLRYYKDFTSGSNVGSEEMHINMESSIEIDINAGDDTRIRLQNPDGPVTVSKPILISAGSSCVLEGYTNKIQYNGNELAYVSNSSRRYKDDIKKLTDKSLDPHKLLKLEIKQFKYKEDFEQLQYKDMKGKTLPGFIAEEVAKIYPSAVIHNEDGEVESWDERRLIPGMLSLIQEQHDEIQALKSELAEIKELLKGVVK